MACQARGIEPDMNVATRFTWHHARFDSTRDYFVLEYPSPPPVDMSAADPESLLRGNNPSVLAPHFSAILCGESAATEYYILGQAPLGGGTTLRCILPEGMNCNLGPGPKPDLHEFLDAIRQSLHQRDS